METPAISQTVSTKYDGLMKFSVSKQLPSDTQNDIQKFTSHYPVTLEVAFLFLIMGNDLQRQLLWASYLYDIP